MNKKLIHPISARSTILAVMTAIFIFLALAFPVPVSAAEYQDAKLPAADLTYSTTYNASPEDSAELLSGPAVTRQTLSLQAAPAMHQEPVSAGSMMTSPLAFIHRSLSAGVMLTHINATVDMDTLFGGIVDIIIKMSSYVGMILVIGGIFQLILAYKDDNADAQSKSIRHIVVGASLMGLRIFLVMAGIIS